MNPYVVSGRLAPLPSTKLSQAMIKGSPQALAWGKYMKELKFARRQGGGPPTRKSQALQKQLAKAAARQAKLDDLEARRQQRAALRLAKQEERDRKKAEAVQRRIDRKIAKDAASLRAPRKKREYTEEERKAWGQKMRAARLAKRGMPSAAALAGPIIPPKPSVPKPVPPPIPPKPKAPRKTRAPRIYTEEERKAWGQKMKEARARARAKRRSPPPPPKPPHETRPHPSTTAKILKKIVYGV